MKPLSGLRVVEIASIGPGPFAAMMLADHGADVVRIDRPGGAGTGFALGPHDPTQRGRRTVELNLKDENDRDRALRLIDRADALVEGYRPGVMERLGLSPKVCRSRNPKLVFARMTGFGQNGPLAHAAGHDINYIALTGALDAIGPASRPVPPLNLVGDYGGGGMLLLFGLLAALLRARETGQGAVVDAAMVDGASLLMAMPQGLRAAGMWPGERDANLLDGGAPFYAAYRTKDDRFIAIGAIEEPFWQELRERMELTDPIYDRRMDPRAWGEIRALLEVEFAKRTRDEWSERLEGSDVCFSPVLSMSEVHEHRAAEARGAFERRGKVTHPTPAPRYDGERETAADIDLEPAPFEDFLERWSG